MFLISRLITFRKTFTVPCAMIYFTTIIILGQPNVVLNLKKGYDKTLRNISTVIENWLRIDFITTNTNLARLRTRYLPNIFFDE